MEDGLDSDDIIIPINLTRLISVLMTVEERERTARREEADRRFLAVLKKEVFDGE